MRACLTRPVGSPTSAGTSGDADNLALWPAIVDVSSEAS